MDTYDREKLYLEVWKEPLTAVCKRYNISDVGLRKVCKLLQIPLPAAGYWAKIYAGKAVISRPILPPYEGPDIRMVPPRENKAEELTPPMLQEFHQLMNKIPLLQEKLVVPLPGRRHKLVGATEIAFRKPGKDSRDFLVPDKRINLDITVAETTVPRALDIANTLIFGLEAIGCRIHIDNRHTFIALKGQQISLRISESAKRSDTVLSKDDLARLRRGQYIFAPKWQYASTGRLTIALDSWRISDSPKARLEDCISEMIFEVVRRANEKQRFAEERRLAEIEREKKREIAWARKREQDVEREKLKKLEGQADQWARAQKLRNYIMAMEKTGVDIDWLSWAKDMADWLDPLTASPNSILDEQINLNPW